MLENKADLALWELVKDFLPEKIFDAHCHLFSPELLPEESVAPQKYGSSTAKDFLRSVRFYMETGSCVPFFCRTPSRTLAM